METIKNYLDNMFANLPMTSEVKKAKEELLQMMEDKYNELTAEGKSANEAVGTVISEFGNLNEIAQELGIDSVVEATANDTRREISLDEAKEFLTASKTKAFQIAIGVAFCIFSVTGPILFDFITVESTNFSKGIADGLGIAFMFVMIAVAVVLFVYSATRMKKWEFLEKDPCRMNQMTTEYVKDDESANAPGNALKLSIGVALCIMSIVPAIILGSIEDYMPVIRDSGSLGGALLFLFVAVGVFFIVFSSIVKGSYEDLFKAAGRKNKNAKKSADAKGEEEVSGSGNIYTASDDDYSEKIYVSKTAEVVMEVFWPTVTCIYLCWSFLTFGWFITWVIWPIAAVAHVALEAALMKRA